MTTNLFRNGGASVTAVGETYDDIQPYVRYAVGYGLTAEVGTSASFDGRAVRPSRYPAVTIQWTADSTGVADLAQFLLTVLSIQDPGDYEATLTSIRDQAERDAAQFRNG